MGYEVPFHEGPILCPHCGVEANYVDSEVVYNGKSYGMIYLCSNFPTCDARTSARGKGRPVGTLARYSLRKLRKQCHARLDPLWKEGKMGRSKAYAFLAQLMNLQPEVAHVGQFNQSQCQRFLMRIDCPICVKHPNIPGPDHEGSSACRNFRVTGHGAIAAGGTVAHCTCAGCF